MVEPTHEHFGDVVVLGHNNRVMTAFPSTQILFVQSTSNTEHTLLVNEWRQGNQWVIIW